MNRLATAAGLAVLGLAAALATATPSAASPWSRHIQACFDRWGWHYDPHSNLVHLHGHLFECRFEEPPPLFWGPSPPPVWGPPGPWHRHFGPPMPFPPPRF